MRHLKLASHVLIAALAVMFLGGLTACGSSEPSEDSSPKTYRNDEYGFSVTVPGSYEEALPDMSDISETAQENEADVPDFIVEFSDDANVILPSAYDDTLWVAVFGPDPTLSQQQVSEMEEWLSDYLDFLVEDIGNATVVKPLQAVEINGLSGYMFSIKYPLDDESGLHAVVSFYHLVDGKYMYKLIARGGALDWDELPEELEAAVMSFRLD